ncbi:MAG: four helix bundle protein [Deltaproteobacteria bacterium]|nr:four helix bundle protein [Deltaproteobacteria bacterium]
MKDFRKQKVWQKSHQLTLDIYKVTGNFPREEVYGLTNQIRRSCASIPANIAEGCGRNSDADFSRFLQIAMGSAAELEYHLLLSHDLFILGDSDYKDLSNRTVEIKQMLTFYQKAVS